MYKTNEIDERWLNYFLRTYSDAKSANSSFLILNKFCRRIKSINMTKQPMSSAKIRFSWLIDCFSDLTNMCFFSWFITRFFSWSINTFFRNRAICRQVIVADSLEIHHCNRLTVRYDHCSKLIKEYSHMLYWCDFLICFFESYCFRLLNLFFCVVSTFWFFLFRFWFFLTWSRENLM